MGSTPVQSVNVLEELRKINIGQYEDMLNRGFPHVSLHDEAMALIDQHNSPAPREMVFADLINPTTDEWHDWPEAFNS